ncbi:uncharacterized protein SPAPADRAFT_60254 [Spathaspora passalidarum NRRL Y-27907]|uniref:Thioesterase domain-containing protein n=1 Tax=Spathaspora passalidarum (strain NRRL Y-27907 / 11-Y1) TaxID=619300 RepID=G3AKF3_SPAPN|nr:uncharacterized protein SPAPADRAFT_60254 [Spathaspora passalidarum NRRL Y-27907]EGW32910.1 hypothetical protein SPAPADRAFT_60254 [Spathaspora passalidarum NRRL Y-27907]
MSEVSTLVNSQGVKELSHDEVLTNSIAYQHYFNRYNEFTSTHKSTLDIKERLFPNLTGDTLVGPDKINLRTPSLYFIQDSFLQQEQDIEDSKNENFAITFFHLGNKLSGHNGIVHGGLLATLLDELTCRLAFLNFKSKRGVTANLNINYKQPTYTDNFVMIKCEIIKKQGRKCWVKGDVYKVDINDSNIEASENLLTSCEVLVIEPKWVEKIQNGSE